MGESGPVGHGESFSAGGALARRTYFLSGFDPRGVAHYQRLFQRELKLQGVRLGRRQTDQRLSRWTLDADADAAPAHELCFLHWDDVARSHWPTNPLVLLRQCADFAGWYLLRGGLLRYALLCPGVALCGAYPLLWLLCGFILIGGGAWGVIAALSLIEVPLLFTAAVVLLWSGLSALVLWKLAERYGVVWLSRSIVFTHRLGQARDGDLRQCVGELVDQLLVLELQCPAQEVWLVGHSSGSFVLAMVAAELHRRSQAVGLLQRLHLLTLGQNLANLALYSKASRFREDLQELTTGLKIPWTDVTSHQDLLCFADVNPYTSCGLTPPNEGHYPQMVVVNLARFRGAQRRRDWLSQLFDLHFDYLRSGCPGVDLPGLLVGGDG